MARRTHVKDPSSRVDIPITPILDLSFNLLFFFVITYNPVKFIEGDIDMSLPVAEDEASEKPPEDPPPSEEKPDETVNMTIVLKAVRPGLRDEGMINEIYTETEAEPKKAIRPNLNDDEKRRADPLNLEELQSRLKAIAQKRKEKKDKSNVVKVKADANLKLTELVKIMDACKGKKPVDKAVDFEVSFVQPQREQDRRPR